MCLMNKTCKNELFRVGKLSESLSLSVVVSNNLDQTFPGYESLHSSQDTFNVFLKVDCYAQMLASARHFCKTLADKLGFFTTFSGVFLQTRENFLHLFIYCFIMDIKTLRLLAIPCNLFHLHASVHFLSYVF